MSIIQVGCLFSHSILDGLVYPGGLRADVIILGGPGGPFISAAEAGSSSIRVYTLHCMDMWKKWLRAFGKCKTNCVAYFIRVERDYYANVNRNASYLQVGYPRPIRRFLGKPGAGQPAKQGRSWWVSIPGLPNKSMLCQLNLSLST